MCFVHKHMQNADFGQILGRRGNTKRHVTSRPMVRFSQTWYQKMRKTWKKKLMKRRVAICGGREAVADFVQGGVTLTPPPPVKIGLKQNNCSSCCFLNHIICFCKSRVMLRFVRQGKILFVPLFIFIEEIVMKLSTKKLICEDNDERNYWSIF